MPRSHEVQSGPEDSAEAVCYSDGELVSRSAAEESDGNYEGDSEAAPQHNKKHHHSSIIITAGESNQAISIKCASSC